MIKYLVRIAEHEEDLQALLNNMSKEGWKFNSLETEYTKFICIFEKDETEQTLRDMKSALVMENFQI